MVYRNMHLHVFSWFWLKPNLKSNPYSKTTLKSHFNLDQRCPKCGLRIVLCGLQVVLKIYVDLKQGRLEKN